jgi:hypothetical protein
MEKQFLNSSTPYLITGRDIFFILDIFSVNNIYQIQVRHLSNKEDLRYWKLRIWNLFLK